jgi:copper resistance protein D
VSVDATLVLCRFLRDASAMIMWGAFAHLATLVPPDLAEEIDQKLATFRKVGGLLVLAMTALLPEQVRVIGDGWSDAFNAQTIRDVVFQTSVGRAWQVQVVAAYSSCSPYWCRNRGFVYGLSPRQVDWSSWR